MKEVVSIVTDENKNKQGLFMCPGCGSAHAPYIEGSGVPVWGFNNNLIKPTFTPSILVRVPAYPEASEEFKKYRKEQVCHSFVTDGQIRFLNDCTHDLAGKTASLKPI
jgi:hypothetical protein